MPLLVEIVVRVVGKGFKGVDSCDRIAAIIKLVVVIPLLIRVFLESEFECEIEGNVLWQLFL